MKRDKGVFDISKTFTTCKLNEAHYQKVILMIKMKTFNTALTTNCAINPI